MKKRKQGHECPSFSMMIKPMGSLCNLNCRYCYYHDKNELLHLENHRMKDEILEEFIRQYLSIHPGPVVSFVFHGGEPTLAGLDFYKRVVELQKRHNIHNYQIWNNIQTNGILLNEQWAEFLSENHFDVGLSIDGTEVIHNYYRGEDTYQKVKNACALLQNYNIQPDLLCTVTSQTVRQPVEVYKTLKSLNTGWMQFIPIVVFENGKTTEDSVTGKEYGQFLNEIFDYWYHNDINSTGIQIVAETMMRIMGQQPSLCTLAEKCGQALVLEHDGSVFSCDHYVFEDYFLGNISEVTLDEMICSEKLKSFACGKCRLSEKCLKCSVLKYCQGACQKDRILYEGEKEKRSILCEGYEMFFNHVEEPLKQIVSLMRKGYNLQQIEKIIGLEGNKDV